MGRICVIFNPIAGRKRASRRMEMFRKRWNGRADFRPTDTSGHAQSLARQAVEEGFATIVAAGGDGTVHEVANGIIASGADDVTFGVVPVGSANDYAFSIEQQFGVAELDDEAAATVDVGVLRTSDERECHFVESLGIGLTGDVTVEAQQIPDRQGLWLYGTAAFRVLWRRQPPLGLRIQWGDEPPVEAPTRMLSVLLGQREGRFLMARQARLDDGLFDIVHGGAISHWGALALLPRFLLGGPPANHPLIALRRCRRLRVESREPLAIHTDGEVFATKEQDVRDVAVEVLPSRLRVKVCRL